jgi:hypothetical protein
VRILYREGQRSDGIQPMVHSLERDRIFAPVPEAVDDLDLLREDAHPLPVRREGEAEGLVLPLEPAGAHPQLHPAARDVIDRRDELREDRWMAERDRRDHRAEPDPLRHGGEPRERRPRVERPSFARPIERQVVIGTEQPLEAPCLTDASEVHPLLPGDALLPFDHHADLHVPPLMPAGSPRTGTGRALDSPPT